MTEKELERFYQDVCLELLLTGTCTTNMTLDPTTGEAKTEIINPFVGCGCEESE